MKLIGWKMKKRVLLIVLVLFWLPTLSFAQEFPRKPINLLVSWAPGVPSGVATRFIANAAEKFLGQPFAITDNGGGGGTVALGIVAKEKPDGYHLLGTNSSPFIRIPQLRSVAYKREDFIPILQYGEIAGGMGVRADSPWKTLKEFVEYAKKNPGKVTYTAIGINTVPHFAMEYIAKAEGIQWTFVPHSGADPIILLLGGHVDACSGGTQFIPHVEAGKVRLLATDGEKRWKDYPEVPTYLECGYGFVSDAILMIAAPKGTPLSIVKKLEGAFRRAMDEPEFVQGMEKLRYPIRYRNHEDVEKYLEESYGRVTKMIIDLKIPTEVEKK